VILWILFLPVHGRCDSKHAADNFPLLCDCQEGEKAILEFLQQASKLDLAKPGAGQQIESMREKMAKMDNAFVRDILTN